MKRAVGQHQWQTGFPVTHKQNVGCYLAAAPLSDGQPRPPQPSKGVPDTSTVTPMCSIFAAHTVGLRGERAKTLALQAPVGLMCRAHAQHRCRALGCAPACGQGTPCPADAPSNMRCVVQNAAEWQRQTVTFSQVGSCCRWRRTRLDQREAQFGCLFP
jgi:hypothetical protein